MAPFWLAYDFPAKLFDKLSSNMKAQSNALSIQLLSRIQEAKYLEQFFLVLFLNTYTWVLDRYLKHAVILVYLVLYEKWAEFVNVICKICIMFDKFCFYNHWTSWWCKLDSIRDQIDKYLLESLWIWTN